MDVGTVISLVIASIGAILGIVNTLYAFKRDTVKLRVEPIKIRYHNNEIETSYITIRVVNLSNFPIYITEVGFTLPKRRDFVIMRYFFNRLHTVDEFKKNFFLK